MINWLTSYPKSGNTWVRTFLSAYVQDAEPDINDLVATYTDQDIPAHSPGFGLKLADISDQHRPMVRPMALLRTAYTFAGRDPEFKVKGKGWPLILKSHAANINAGGIRLVPPEITDKTVYIVRDPRDVVMSFAKHYGKDVKGAIDAITHSKVALFDVDFPNKPHSYATNWRTNVFSYASAKSLDVTIVKYEQLKEDPVKYFTHILKWYGIPVIKARVKRAVKNCELSKLQKQEKEHGFQETSKHAKKFFGKGLTGGWKGKLSKKQQQKIEDSCHDMMVEFGYLEK